MREINRAPVLTAVADQTLDEGVPFALSLTAEDPDEPANALRFALVEGPAGLTVGENGALAWTPSEAQGPGSYPVRVNVTDDGQPPLSHTHDFVLSVREVVVAGPRVEASITGLMFRLEWAAIPGRRYQVQVLDDLGVARWSDLGAPSQAATHRLTLVDPLRAEGGRFYRVVLLP